MIYSVCYTLYISCTLVNLIKFIEIATGRLGLFTNIFYLDLIVSHYFIRSDTFLIWRLLLVVMKTLFLNLTFKFEKILS